MTLFVFKPPKSGLLQQSIPDGLTFFALFLKSEILCLKETHVLTAPEHAAPYTGSMHFSTVDGALGAHGTELLSQVRIQSVTTVCLDGFN